MISLEEARSFALSLPEATEEPHFDMMSFRVRGKIFATVPPDGACIHVFVDELEGAASAAEDAAAFEPLRWGQRIRGLKIHLAHSPPGRARELIEESWRRQAPRRVAADFESRRRP